MNSTDTQIVNDNYNEELIHTLGYETPTEKTVELIAVTNCPYLEEKCADIQCPCPKYHAWEKIENNPDIIEQKISELKIDPNDTPWNVLMSMQKVFAGRFHNTTNMTKDEKDHWINEYLICIEDEICELLDHVTMPLSIETVNGNQEECKKEVIDILHFVMDAFIAGEATPDGIKTAYFKKYTTGVLDVEDFLKFAYDNQILQFYYNEEARKSKRENTIDIDTILVDVSLQLLQASRKVRQQISWKHWSANCLQTV